MMLPGKWKFFARYDEMWPGATRLVMAFDEENGTRSIVTEMKMQTISLDQRFPDDTPIAADVATDFLRAALNAAWEIGMRPDGFNDTRESMAATNHHLQDMRALVFGVKRDVKL